MFALLAGTAAAFAVTEALKLERSPITAPRFDKVFSPTCGCEKETARLAFRLRRADTVDAVVIDSAGDPVRTLADETRRGRGVVAFTWDGRDDAGRLVADGRYRLRVHVADERRTIVIPNTVKLDTTAPGIEVVRVRRRAFSPDDDGRADRFTVRFRTDEAARGVMLVDGVRAVRGRLHPAGAAGLAWQGKVDGRLLGPGVYDVVLQAVDRAGNASDATAPIRVRLRYIEVAPRRIRVVRGGRLAFTVSTDARPFRWSLHRVRTGVVRARPSLAGRAARKDVVVDLPRRLRAGRYVLRVVANGRRDASIVTIARGPR